MIHKSYSLTHLELWIQEKQKSKAVNTCIFVHISDAKLPLQITFSSVRIRYSVSTNLHIELIEPSTSTREVFIYFFDSFRKRRAGEGASEE